MSKRHIAGRAALGLSCGACFERLAGVSASRVASVAALPRKAEPNAATSSSVTDYPSSSCAKSLLQNAAGF